VEASPGFSPDVWDARAGFLGARTGAA
jgi:hypothetical protein